MHTVPRSLNYLPQLSLPSPPEANAPSPESGSSSVLAPRRSEVTISKEPSAVSLNLVSCPALASRRLHITGGYIVQSVTSYRPSMN